MATHNLTRHSGKPTSGRYVFKSNFGKEWYWVCDLCEEWNAPYPTQPEAFRGAMIHALVCLDDNANARYAGTNTTLNAKETK